MKPLRVIHVIPSLFDPAGRLIGGAERYAIELARHMARHTPTRLVSFGDKPSTSKVDDLDVTVLKPSRYIRGQWNNPYSPRIWRLLRDADVIHCHQRHVLISSLIALWARIHRKPVFVTDHGGGGWDLSAYVDTSKWYRGVLHVSQYSRRVAGHEGLSSARVVYGGVDTEKFAPDASSRHDGPVLFVGRLFPHKGVDVLVRACGQDIPLDIIGRPTDERYLADLRAMIKGPNIRFVFDADDTDIIRAYQRARCVVLPSVYETMYGEKSLVPELLGQTLIEAMACGTPAICSDVASMPEVVAHGETGFVVAPADSSALRERLLELGNDPAQVSRMGAAARARVESCFTWSAVLNRCMEAYRG